MRLVHRLPPALVCLVVVWSVAACGTPAPQRPDYKPVPDRSLYARIGDLPGVTEVDIVYKDSPGDPETYVGSFRVKAGTDPLRRLDQAMAILRQGRFQAAMSLSVYPPDRPAIYSDALAGYTRTDLDKRYGPQPGDGKPPESTPAAP